MGKFDGYLFLTDMDGTLTQPGEPEISQANCQAIRYFQAEGGRFTVATGRSPDFIRNYMDLFRPNAPLITLNGAMICSEDGCTPLKEFFIDEKILDVLSFLLPHPYMYCVYFGNGITQYNRMMEGTLEEKLNYYAALPKPWYKIVTRQPEEFAQPLMAELEQKFGHLYEFDRSYSMGIEIHKKGSGKGACLDWLINHSPDPIRVTIAAGDYENDISMIRKATIGYAVSNAIDSVKHAADRITVSHKDSAIARIIEELDRNPI